MNYKALTAGVPAGELLTERQLRKSVGSKSLPAVIVPAEMVAMGFCQFTMTIVAFAPATHKATAAPDIEVSPGVWEQRWSVVALSAPELAAKEQAIDAQKQAQVDGIEKLEFYLAFNHENRIRALESKAALTAAQFRAALKAQL